MHKILISSLLLFLALVLPTQANQVTVLIEGYDRFPRVGSTVTLIRGDGINVITDPGMMQEPKMLIVALRAEGLSVRRHHPRILDPSTYRPHG